MPYEYFLILLLLTVVATAIKLYLKVRLFKNLPQMIITYSILMLIGMNWDHYAISRGHWSYPGQGISGIFIGLIPLEDFFFGLVCIYFILTIYKILNRR